MKKVLKTTGILIITIAMLLIAKYCTVTITSTQKLVETVIDASSKTFDFSYTNNYVEVDSAENKIAEYTTLKDALSGCANGNTIYLMNDVTESKTAAYSVSTSKSITFNTNGYTLDMGAYYINLSGSGNFTLEGDGTINATGTYTIYHGGSGKFTIKDSVINTSGTQAIYQCGTGQIEIAGGEINATGTYGLYNYGPGNGAVIITGGKITAKTAIAGRSKTTTIIGNNDGTVSTVSPEIIASSKCVSGTSVEYYDGILKTTDYNNLISCTSIVYPEGYSPEITYDGEFYTEVLKNQGVYAEYNGDTLVNQYSNLSDTFTNATSGNTIKVVSSSDYLVEQSTGTLSETKNLTFDTNGRTINLGSRKIQNSGTGTLKIIGGGTINGDQPIYNGSEGTIILNECTINATNYAINNYSSQGTVTISDCTLNNTDTSYQVISNTGILSISDSTLNRGIYTTGELTINGGTITSTANGISNSGTATISDVVITSENSGISNSGTSTINDVTINSRYLGINNSGTISINGGKINSSESNGIYNSSSGTVDIGSNDGNVSGTSPEIISINKDPLSNSGTINFYDGILKYSTSTSSYTIEKSVTSMPDGYSLVYGTGCEGTDTVSIAYLSNGESKPYEVYSGTTLKGTYSTLQEAFDAADSGDRIEVIQNANETSTTVASITSEKDIMLNLNGYSISPIKNVENNSTGTLTINGDTTEIGGYIYGQIINSGSGNIVINRLNTYVVTNNGGTLTVSDSYIGGSVLQNLSGETILKNDEIAITIYNSDKMTLNNCSCNDYKSCLISNSGDVIVNEGDYNGTYMFISGGKSITIDGANFEYTNTSAPVINGGIQKITNSDFNVQGSNVVIYDGQSGSTIENCTIKGSYQAAIGSGTYDVEDVTIENTYTGTSDCFGVLSFSGTISNSDITVKAENANGTTMGINGSNVTVSGTNVTVEGLNTTGGVQGVYGGSQIIDSDIDVTAGNASNVYGVYGGNQITDSDIDVTAGDASNVVGASVSQQIINSDIDVVANNLSKDILGVNGASQITDSNISVKVNSASNAYGVSSSSKIQNSEISLTTNSAGANFVIRSSDTIDGGTIYLESTNESATIAANIYGSTTIGKNDGNISTSSPVIINNTTVDNTNYVFVGTVNFYDGILKTAGDVSNLYSTTPTIPKDAELINDTETIDGVTYNTAYLSQLEGWYWDSDTKTISRNYIDGYEDFATTENLKALITAHSTELEIIDFSPTSIVDANDPEYAPFKIPTSDYKELFKDCTKLTTVIDFFNLDYSDATDISSMFENCTSLTSIDLSSYGSFQNIENMSSMFKGCSSLKTVDNAILGEFGASEVDCSSMFEGCTSLEEIDIDIIGSDDGTTINMESMFTGDTSLKTASKIDLENVTITSMANMFKDDESLKQVDFIGVKLDIEDMSSLFENCTVLKKVTYSPQDDESYCLDTVRNMKNMFKNCSSIENIEALIYMDTTNLESDGMQDLFTGTDSLNRIVLGQKVVELTENCGLTGENWVNLQNGTTYTADELIETFSGDTLAGAYISTVLDGHYYRSISQNLDNLYEVHNPDQTMTGYCINLGHHGFGTYLDRTLITTGEALVDNYLGTAEEGSTHGTGTIGTDMRQVLITLMYYGYSNDADGIQAKYGLTDLEYQQVTQNAIWDYTDRYGNPSGPTLFTGNQLLAYNELISKKYTDIPNADNLLFYVYDARDDTQQNMISLASVDDQPYAGVEVKKVDEDGNPVIGAVFNVVNEDTGETYTMTSNSEGIASICRADHIYGLVEGKYKVQEITAPTGYNLSSDYYEFEVTSDNANSVIQIGYKNDDEYQEIMKIIDSEDESVVGGGIKVTKLTDEGDTLTGVEVTVYSDEACTNEVISLTTNADGIAMSSKKYFAPGKYYVKETTGAYGYVTSDEVSEVTIEDDAYSELTLTNEAKIGTVIIEADKVLDGEDISKFKFTYQLVDDEGNVIQTKTTDSTGHVKFDAISLKAAEGTYKNYTIREVCGTEAYIEYDTHSEEVTVMISDEGGENLVCTPVYDSDGAIFTNKILNSGVTVSKTVSGNKGDTTKEFKYTFAIDNSDKIVATKTLADETTTTVELKNGSTFILKDGEKITFSIKRGSTYSVTEETTDYTTIVNGTTSNSYTSTIGESDEIVAFTNELNVAPLLGVNNKGFSIFATFMIIIAGMGVMYMFIKRHVRVEYK